MPAVEPRLCDARLTALPPAVLRPQYDRATADCGIVHLGLGAFHRAHQALYTDEAMNRSGGDWCITGVSMRSAAVAEALRPQDCLYSVLSEDGEGSSLRVIGAVKRVLVAPAERDAVIAAVADAKTRIVTLTITEKGYCTGHDGAALDRSHPEIQADLAQPTQPVTAIGLLALGLQQRCLASAGPLTIISCDNLSENGRVLEAGLNEYVETAFPELLPWLAERVSFPCSMVDRIVPAATAEQRHRQSGLLGMTDSGAIATEPFCQWIIEDRFCTPRPDWTGAGAQLVTDIRPFEAIKLRLLNASHSAIAYCGLLAGVETVDQVMADKVLGGYVRRLMDEDLVPHLQVPAGFDLKDYRDALLDRFGNPRLQHRCVQIAMDGSEKIRQRWLPTLQSGAESLQLLRALAAWCHMVLATDATIDDPRAEHLLALRGQDPQSALDELLACAGVTSATLPDYPRIRALVEQNLNQLAGEGVSGLLAG